MRVVDTHLHLWDPARLEYDWLSGDLDRRYGPEELRAAGGADPETTFVFVQAECVAAQSRDEVRWVAGLAATVGIRGIVARAALERGAGVVEELDALADEPLVVGVRRLLQDEPDGFALAPGFVDGTRALAARGWTFDACVRAGQLREIAALADAVPDLVIVLDHLGKPPVGSASAPRQPDAAWLADLRDLARRPSVHVKLSGLPAESAGEWGAAQVTPFLDAGLTAFGAERLVFGGDWPVSGREDYPRWRDTVAAWALDRLGPEGADGVLRAHAEALYLDR